MPYRKNELGQYSTLSSRVTTHNDTDAQLFGESLQLLNVALQIPDLFFGLWETRVALLYLCDLVRSLSLFRSEDMPAVVECQAKKRESPYLRFRPLNPCNLRTHIPAHQLLRLPYPSHLNKTPRTLHHSPRIPPRLALHTAPDIRPCIRPLPSHHPRARSSTIQARQLLPKQARGLPPRPLQRHLQRKTVQAHAIGAHGLVRCFRGRGFLERSLRGFAHFCDLLRSARGNGHWWGWGNGRGGVELEEGAVRAV